VIAGRHAGRSQRRGKTLFSRCRRPRRSRFDARISTAEIGIRAETPDDWSTNSLARAAKAISSTSSRKNSGISTAGVSRRSSQASCAVMRDAIFTSSG
jgi:hypothetical protein